jgi:pimeloyl-ACP methyl ester carboxylesterase
MSPQVERFEIAIPQTDLDDLQQRLARIRWPGEIGDNRDWQAGANLGFMRALVDYWGDGFDWRAQERALNALPQFRTTIEDVPLHFVHVRGKGPNPKPLILCHGWPWTFRDFIKVIGPLSDPVAHGGDPADAFDVIVPSIPGFAFSSPVTRTDLNPAAIADLLAMLMERLGYDRFAVHGADLGAYIAAMIGHRHADRVIGVHLQHLLEFRKPHLTDDDYAPHERRFIPERDRFLAEGMGYFQIQRTKPQTIAFAMNDSPVGLAAWLVEKRHGWGGTKGNVESAFSKDDLLATVCLYWFTQTYLSAAWHYRVSSIPGARKSLVHDRLPMVEVPVAGQQFLEDIVFRPRAFAEKHFNIVRWNTEERGGHFGAFERPDAVVADLRGFLGGLR